MPPKVEALVVDRRWVLGPLLRLSVGSKLGCPAGRKRGHGLQLALTTSLARGEGGGI